MTKMTRLAAAARRRMRGEEDAEQGFTLIELLVVLLIIGILLAIAIPTFLSVTKSANDTAAQSNLQTALTGSKTYYTEQNQTYQGMCVTAKCGGSATQSGLADVDTGLSLASKTASSGPHVVSVDTNAAGTQVVLAALANGTNNCWLIVDSTASGNTVDGAANFVGTYYIKIANSSATACTSTQTVTGSFGALASTNGFGGI